MWIYTERYMYICIYLCVYKYIHTDNNTSPLVCSSMLKEVGECVSKLPLGGAVVDWWA